MKTVLLGSGTGSNAEAILRAEDDGALGQARVEAIFSDNENAGILAHAAHYGKPPHFISAAPFKTKLDGEAESVWISEIQVYDPDLIVLAGFMRVIKPPFLRAFKNRIINLHPSLLPSFPGLNGIRQAYEYGVKITGCTVHWVNEVVDGGTVIDQVEIRVEGDDLQTLESKMHVAEHRLLPDVVKRLSIGEIPFPQ
ncbi:MAG: phosphoribosylglycinamide formyltransferase [Opitutales bacterium]|nr:phosphoribosylglycinamide formyltransferase [Opitutales bacterium]